MKNEQAQQITESFFIVSISMGEWKRQSDNTKWKWSCPLSVYVVAGGKSELGSVVMKI